MGPKLQEQELQTIRRQINKQGNNGNYYFGVGNLRNNYIATLAYTCSPGMGWIYM